MSWSKIYKRMYVTLSVVIILFDFGRTGSSKHWDYFTVAITYKLRTFTHKCESSHTSLCDVSTRLWSPQWHAWLSDLGWKPTVPTTLDITAPCLLLDSRYFCFNNNFAAMYLGDINENQTWSRFCVAHKKNVPQSIHALHLLMPPMIESSEWSKNRMRIRSLGILNTLWTIMISHSEKLRYISHPNRTETWIPSFSCQVCSLYPFRFRFFQTIFTESAL